MGITRASSLAPPLLLVVLVPVLRLPAHCMPPVPQLQEAAVQQVVAWATSPWMKACLIRTCAWHCAAQLLAAFKTMT